MADDYTIYDILNFLNDLQGDIDEMQAAVNNALNNLPWWVPDWAIKPVYDEWNNLCDEWGAMIQDVEDLVDNVGEAWTLPAAAAAWRDQVDNKLTGIPGKVAAGQLSSDDVFSGVSASAYRGVIPNQTAAMNAVKPQYTAKIADGLDDVADAINKSLSTVQEALVALGVAVAGAIVAIAGAAAVIPLIGGIITCIGALATFAVKIMNAKVQFTTDTQTVQSAWDGVKTDWTNFDGEKWPQATFA